jgi:hypothetical protein
MVAGELGPELTEQSEVPRLLQLIAPGAVQFDAVIGLHRCTIGVAEALGCLDLSTKGEGDAVVPHRFVLVAIGEAIEGGDATNGIESASGPVREAHLGEIQSESAFAGPDLAGGIGGGAGGHFGGSRITCGLVLLGYGQVHQRCCDQQGGEFLHCSSGG